MQGKAWRTTERLESVPDHVTQCSSLRYPLTQCSERTFCAASWRWFDSEVFCLTVDHPVRFLLMKLCVFATMCMRNDISLLWALCSLLLFLCAASDKELYHRVQQQLRMCRNINLIVDYNASNSACLKTEGLSLNLLPLLCVVVRIEFVFSFFFFFLLLHLSY